MGGVNSLETPPQDNAPVENESSYLDNWQYKDLYVTFEIFPPTSPIDICFVGDSLTAKGNWNEFFADLSITNRGIGSDVSEGVLNRLDTVVNGNPKLIFLMIGVNDLYRDIPEDFIVDNVRRIIEELHSSLPNAIIFLESVLPTDSYIDETKSLNSSYETLASQYEYVNYLNLYPLFLNDDGDLNLSLYSAAGDNCHLSGAGYRVWVDEVKRAIDSSV